MLLNFILIAAVIGIIGAFLSWVFDGLQNVLASLLSYVFSGLIAGLVLFGIMFLGTLFCICDDWYLFGIHSFWLGFIIGMVYEIYFTLRVRFA